MKKLIAFLLTFTVLAVGITYGCIQYTLRLPDEEVYISEAGIDLNGFYDENDLVMTEIREDTDDMFISYPQFEGLKNTEVQNGINDLIRSEAKRLIEQDIAFGGDIRYLSYNVSGSFANTLSVGLYSAHEQVYLNFNLNDGSQLRLEDLFAADADLQGIVHGAFYDALTRGNLSNTYWEDVNYPDEQQLYKTVKAYLNGENRQFLFTPAGIYLYYNDYMAEISMTEYAEDIVIYNKYLTGDSLFVADGVGYENVFTCAEMPRGFARREFGFAADNFWYDIALSEAYLEEKIPAEAAEQFLVFYDDLYEGLLEEAIAIREEALAHPEKAYILLANPNGHIYTDFADFSGVSELYTSCAAEVCENYSLYEMPIELFESKYRAALMELYRTGTYTMFYCGLDEYIDGGEVQETHRRSYELYNYETGSRLTVDDIFVDGYDYGAAVRANAKYDLVSYYGYTMEAAELAVQAAWYEVSGVGLNVYLPEWGTQQYLSMPLRDFPRIALKIFE
ncbi:MAG: hypothetical protein IJD81_09090 [Oscillospiraceae bacterium]|nr:hypothetical protein [Oscillospiraceae bacterium]